MGRLSQRVAFYEPTPQGFEPKCRRLGVLHADAPNNLLKMPERFCILFSTIDQIYKNGMALGIVNTTMF